MNLEGYEFLLWLGKGKLGLPKKVWKKYYPEVIQALYAKSMGW